MYKLSPSKAHRFLNCTMSLNYDTAFVENEQTKRGSMLHKIAEMLIKQEDTTEIEIENEVNEYEKKLVLSYANAVWQEYNFIGGQKITIENKMSIEIYGVKINVIIDTLIISNNVASIIDLKTGRGDVDPNENEQLYFYAYAVIQKYPQVKEFRLSIYQKMKIKTIEVSKAQVLDFFISKEKIFEEIEYDMLSFNPSEKACKFCAHKDVCVARANWIIGGKK